MKQLIKMSILAAILMILCIPPVSAFTVDSYSCDPSGTLTSNTPVTVSYDIGFASTSDTTFPSESDLVMTTALANPKWTYTLILDGVENTRSPVSGTTLELSGFDLSYPSSVTEKIHITLTGTAPSVSTSTSTMILNVHEVNSAGSTVTSTQVAKTAIVNSAAQTTTPTTVASTVKTTAPTAVPTTIQLSRFTVDNYTCNPSGSLTPNTPVTVSYNIGFTSTSDTTFPPGSDLVMTTDLTNPKWVYSLILDGVENTKEPVSGKTIELSGFEVSYPSSVTEKMRVTLTGTVPSVSTTTSKVILNVHEVNSAGSTVTSTQVTKTAVVNSAAQTTSIPSSTKVVTPITTAVVHTGVVQVPLLETVGNVMGISSDTGAKNLNHINMSVALASGASAVDFSQMEVTYGDGLTVRNNMAKDDSSRCSETMTGSKAKWCLAQKINGNTNDILEPNEIFVIAVGMPETATPNTEFTITLQPSAGAPLSISRMVPASINKVNAIYESSSPSTTSSQGVTSTTKSVNQLLEEQNAKIEEQNKLIAEQNAKMAQQNGLLDQIIGMFKGLFGI